MGTGTLHFSHLGAGKIELEINRSKFKMEGFNVTTTTSTTGALAPKVAILKLIN